MTDNNTQINDKVLREALLRHLLNNKLITFEEFEKALKRKVAFT